MQKLTFFKCFSICQSRKISFLISQSIRCLILLSLFILSAQAIPPKPVATQTPGYYRMALGKFEVTALYDGFVMIDPSLMKGAEKKDIQILLTNKFANSALGLQTSVNTYLINTGTHLILVDTGAGECLSTTTGHLIQNILAAGYQVDQIDTILLTHLHVDHVCGISDKDGNTLFANAKVWVADAEANYWLNPDNMTDELKASFNMVKDALAPYIATNRFATYKPMDQLLPGLTIVPAYGHTPGHSAYQFQSEGQTLLIWGDIVHNHAVQFQRPEVSFDFDTDSQKAMKIRAQLFSDVAKNRWWVAGAHLPFPGLGHLLAEAETYHWIPIEYAPVQ